MSIHSRSRYFVLLITVLAVASACTDPPQQESVVAPPMPAMDTLVTTEWLSEHLDDPNLVVLDCTVMIEPDENGGIRVLSGRTNYEKGHIPTAGFADLMGELSDSDSKLQFAVPTPEQFSAAMGALGVGDDTRVVLYDGYNSAWAARVWWMLRWVGFDQAAVLDGGFRAWTEEGRAVTSEPANQPARHLTPAPRPHLIADRNEVLAAVDSHDVKLVDAMPEAHYRGEMSMYARPGHIPGASNVPASSLIDESGRYRSRDELAALIGADQDERSITYCGGGIAASSNAFIMTRLGHKDVAVYTASLQEWAADPANPLITLPASGDE